MKARHLIPLVSVLLCGNAMATETLELEIVTANGARYSASRELGETFESFDSGVIRGEAPPREYKAIRCDGPWGAIRYSLPLASGPGYQVRADGERLSLQIVEHAVISADRNIEAMKMHCIDTEPKQVVRSLLKVELDRGSRESRQVVLANGYRLVYRYTP